MTKVLNKILGYVHSNMHESDPFKVQTLNVVSKFRIKELLPSGDSDEVFEEVNSEISTFSMPLTIFEQTPENGLLILKDRKGATLTLLKSQVCYVEEEFYDVLVKMDKYNMTSNYSEYLDIDFKIFKKCLGVVHHPTYEVVKADLNSFQIIVNNPEKLEQSLDKRWMFHKYINTTSIEEDEVLNCLYNVEFNENAYRKYMDINPYKVLCELYDYMIKEFRTEGGE